MVIGGGVKAHIQTYGRKKFLRSSPVFCSSGLLCGEGVGKEKHTHTHICIYLWRIGGGG